MILQTPLGCTMKTKISILLLLFFNLNAHELIRLGTKYGGWTIPKNLLHKNSIVYCAGAGEDISFDVTLAKEFQCNVFIFDPTPRSIKHFDYICNQTSQEKKAHINNKPETYDIDVSTLERLHFYPFGLWHENIVMKFYEPQNPAHVSHSLVNLQKTKNYFSAPCKRLDTIMQELGHHEIDLLKLDIEGAEYTVLDTIIEKQLPIRCICIEFDEFAGINLACNTNKKASVEKTKRYIRKLQQTGYTIIYQNGYTDITFLKEQ